MRQLAADLRHKGTALFVAEPGDAAAGRLPALAARPRRDRRRLPRPELLSMAIALAKHLGTDVDQPPPSAEGHADPMSGIEPTRGAGRHRLRRHGRAP